MNHRTAILLLAGIVCLSAAACVSTPKPVYEVHHAALVPPPAPPMWSGKTRHSGISHGNSSVLWSSAPSQAVEGDAGLYVASIQADGTIHVDLGPSGQVAIWVPFSYGLPDYAFSIKPCLIDKPKGGTFTGGIGLAAWTPITGPWYIGFSLETLLTYIPTRIVATCTENCENASTQFVDNDDWTVKPTLRFGLASGLDFDWVRIFVGFNIRNHHMNKEGRTVATRTPDNIGNTVEFGRTFVLLGGGVEVDLGRHVSLLAQVYKPFDTSNSRTAGVSNTIHYGPIVGASLDVHFPRRRAAQVAEPDWSDEAVAGKESY